MVALGAWLLWRRRWLRAAGLGAAFGAPALAWWLRGRRAEGGAYLSELWMRNPYRPELGTAGLGDLLARVAENAWLYTSWIFPEGILGVRGSVVAAVGVAWVAAALVGWFLRLRRDLSVAELFAVAYLGLLLLWPQVWSSDRFALPLYPLLLFYGGEALLAGAGRLHRGLPVWAAAAALLVAGGTALSSWADSVREAAVCRNATRQGRPWGCYGPEVRQFVDAARWSGANLPEDAAVFSRKPRIFYVTSGLKSRTYPFSTDADSLLAEADAHGITHLLVDFIGVQSSRYLFPVLQSRPGAFCVVAGFGRDERLRTQLLGVLSPELRGVPGGAGGEPVRLTRCPARWVVPEGAVRSSAAGPGEVPLLTRLDR